METVFQGFGCTRLGQEFWKTADIGDGGRKESRALYQIYLISSSSSKYLLLIIIKPFSFGANQYIWSISCEFDGLIDSFSGRMPWIEPPYQIAVAEMPLSSCMTHYSNGFCIMIWTSPKNFFCLFESSCACAHDQ